MKNLFIIIILLFSITLFGQNRKKPISPKKNQVENYTIKTTTNREITKEYLKKYFKSRHIGEGGSVEELRPGFLDVIEKGDTLTIKYDFYDYSHNIQILFTFELRYQFLVTDNSYSYKRTGFGSDYTYMQEGVSTWSGYDQRENYAEKMVRLNHKYWDKKETDYANSVDKNLCKTIFNSILIQKE